MCGEREVWIVFGDVRVTKKKFPRTGQHIGSASGLKGSWNWGVLIGWEQVNSRSFSILHFKRE